MLGPMTSAARLVALPLLAGSLLLSGACGRSAAVGVEQPARAPLAAPVPTSAPAVAEPETAPTPVPGAPPEVLRPYDEAADAATEIDAALALARTDHKNVLLVFGANWCPWCRRLEHTLRFNTTVAAEVARSFHVVHVDTGARGTGKNAAIGTRYGEPTRLGLPVLVVLTPDGSLKTTQDSGALESGDRHDPAAILAFLARVRG